MQNLHFLKNMLANVLGYYGGLIVLLFRSLSKQITISDVTMYMSAYRASLGSLSALVKTIADIYETVYSFRTCWNTPLSATHSQITACTNR